MKRSVNEQNITITKIKENEDVQNELDRYVS